MYYAVCWYADTESYGKAWISIRGESINMYFYQLSPNEWLTNDMYIVGPFKTQEEAEKYFTPDRF